MKKKFLFMALVLSSLSLSACGTETKTASDNAVVSEAEENTGADEKETEELLEETTEEPEKPKYEPVIALSYEGKEFDISNGTYKDLLAFFQAIGSPSVEDSRDVEIEPYSLYDKAYIEFGNPQGSEELILKLTVYNPTGKTITALDSKISSLDIASCYEWWGTTNPVEDGYYEAFSEDVLIFGVPFKTYIYGGYPYSASSHGHDTRLYSDEVLKDMLSELGFESNDYEFSKIFEDGRMITVSDSYPSFDLANIEITPLFEYEID